MTDPLASFRNKGNAQNAGQQNQERISASQVQDGINYVKEHGGDPQKAAIELLKANGKQIPSNPFAYAMQIFSTGKF